jgi:hypothetical protein
VAQVHIPKGFKADSKLPLVLMLHGAGGSGQYILDKDGWAAKADQERFVAVAPDGLPAFPRLPKASGTNPAIWNSGQLKPNSPRAAVDDVAYLKQLLDQLKTTVTYDEQQVFVVGQATKPGSYTLSSLSTLVNAIFATGGPSVKGSMRHIQLKRGGKVISDFDMYDLLLKGDKSKDMQLLSGDVIYIPPIGAMAAISGSVNTPAIFELKNDDSLSDLRQGSSPNGNSNWKCQIKKKKYRYFKWAIAWIKNQGSSNMIQVSNVRFYDIKKQQIPTSAISIIPGPHNRNPGNEEHWRINDNNAGTKWLDHSGPYTPYYGKYGGVVFFDFGANFLLGLVNK